MGGGTVPPVLERIGRLADGWVCNTLPGRGLEEALGVDPPGRGRRRPVAGRGSDSRASCSPGRARIPPSPCRGNSNGGSRVGATRVAVSGLNAGRTPDEHVAYIVEAGKILLG